MASEIALNSVVVAVLPAEEDRRSLGEILAGSWWKILAAPTLREARLLLKRPSIAAVICEASFPHGQGWKDLLSEMQKMACAPPLIVSHRLADECLWAEVLSLGGYDLLATPVDQKQVLYAVSAACRWREGEERAIAARKLVKLPERNDAFGPEGLRASGGCG